MKKLHMLKQRATYKLAAQCLFHRTLDFLRWCKRFLRANWIGTIIILGCTLLFFWPIVTRIGSYIEGGDAMFNAWTLSRNYHCIMREGCPDYANGNIYFPNKDTMLYSESQLSAGVVTLPLYWISDNPILSYNIFTIASFFLAGWFMYLLTKFISKGKEILPIVAGLVFAFAPIKMASVWHLQNLSIFYLPLIVWLICKFLDKHRRRDLILLLIALVLQFYASWYQMVFVLMAVGVFLIGMKVFRLGSWRQILAVAGVTAIAAASTLPLALQYVHFSKENHASFGIRDQLLYSSSLTDYIKPQNNTLLGKIYYALHPGTQVNAFNMDSYSYHGMILYAVAALVIFLVWRLRKRTPADRKNFGYMITFMAIALVGFVVSLGPLLKIEGNFIYGSNPSIPITIPLPWLIVDKLLPQLEFIRAIGRASILVLFALCCSLGYFALYIGKVKWLAKYKRVIYVVVVGLVLFELMPLHHVQMSSLPSNYNLSVPAVYKFIKAHPEVDDLVTVEGDSDYPGAPIPEIRAEWTLWAGYDNRNTFNGYSGYEPPTYMADYILFKTMTPKAVSRMKQLGLKYVIIDKQLSKTEPWLEQATSQLLSKKIYEDTRYALFRI